VDIGQSRTIAAKILYILPDPVHNPIAHLNARIGDHGMVTRAGKDLRDSMAHQAAAEDRDALWSHRHPAV
jgi:hypothetical protein